MLLDQRLQAQVQPELQPNEEVLWLGRPNPLPVALQYGGPFLMGIIWSVFIANFIRIGSQMGSSSPMDLFMIPFVVVGLGLLLSPVWAYLVGLKTVYAITNDRVLIVQNGIGFMSRQVRSYGKRDLGAIRTEIRDDNSGNLIFAQQSYPDSSGYTRVRNVSLLGIPDVRQVESILRADFGQNIGNA